jgi:hypothetical protein
MQPPLSKDCVPFFGDDDERDPTERHMTASTRILREFFFNLVSPLPESSQSFAEGTVCITIYVGYVEIPEFGTSEFQNGNVLLNA